MTHTKVRFEPSPIDRHAVVAIRTTLEGGLTAHLIDTFARVGISVRKVESRRVDDTWIQSIVVAAPHGKIHDDGLLDELRTAVLATIEAVALSRTVDADETDASSGTFRVAGRP